MSDENKLIEVPVTHEQTELCAELADAIINSIINKYPWTDLMSISGGVYAGTISDIFKHYSPTEIRQKLKDNNSSALHTQRFYTQLGLVEVSMSLVDESDTQESTAFEVPSVPTIQ